MIATTMRSRDEQIEHLLGESTWAWACEQLPRGVSIDDRQYGDFISVTPDEVLAHVLAQGFDPRIVWTPRDPPEQRDERLAIEPRDGQWSVHFAERGTRRDERLWLDPQDAVRDVVMRLLHRAWVTLNHRYWHRHHPTLDALPPFSAPWPDATT